MTRTSLVLASVHFANCPTLQRPHSIQANQFLEWEILWHLTKRQQASEGLVITLHCTIQPNGCQKQIPRGQFTCNPPSPQLVGVIKKTWCKTNMVWQHRQQCSLSKTCCKRARARQHYLIHMNNVKRKLCTGNWLSFVLISFCLCLFKGMRTKHTLAMLFGRIKLVNNELTSDGSTTD